MQQCPHCEGFLPPQLTPQCPHCDATLKKGLPRPLKRVGQLVLGAGAALTLSACYGAPPPASMPPCDDTNQSETQTGDNDSPSAETPKEAPCVSAVTPEDDSETSGNDTDTP